MGAEIIQFPAHRMRESAPTTKAELAARLRVSPRWIEYRMREGMPFEKDGYSRLVSFDITAVEAWLSERRTG